MKIGLMGGTFDPPHKAHIKMAKAAYEQYSLDKVLFMTGGNPPHKKTMTDAKIRNKMIKIAIREFSQFEICEYEINKEEYSYTADTLKYLKSRYPDDEIYFIIGGDSLKAIFSWYKPEEILKNCILLVYPRNSYPDRVDVESFSLKNNADVRLLDIKEEEISSTDLRKMIEENEDVSEYLDKEVYEFIKRNSLYEKKEGSYEERLKKILKPERYAHSIGVAKTAVKLAKKYGADPQKAYIAGLLHDAAKNLSAEETKIKCEDLEADIDEIEKDIPALIHAKLGAEFVKAEFGILDPEVCDAIKWHSLARPEMSTLEKIIYVADMIEPTREFKNAKVLRKAAKKDLDVALLECVTSTIMHNERHGKKVHENAYKTRDWLLSAGVKYMKKGVLYMKKFLAVILVIMMLPTVSVLADGEVEIIVNDVILEQTGAQKAIIKNDITMIPFRLLFESLDAHVEWISSTREIIATKGITLIKLKIGDNDVYVNGAKTPIPQAPEIVDGTTLIPLRAISQMLDAEVDWIDSTRTVVVKTARPSRTVHTEYFVKEFKNANNDTIIKAIAAYPVFDTTINKNLEAVNAMYMSEARDFSSNIVSKYKDEALEAYKKAWQENSEYEPIIAINHTEVVYDEAGFVSIVEQSAFSDASIFDYSAKTINLETGKIMELEDFVLMGEREKEIFAAYDFYINDGRLVLFLTPESKPLYDEYNYPSALEILDDYIKYDLKFGGEKKIYKELTLSGTPERVTKECKTLKELNENLPFEMYIFKNGSRNEAISYKVENSEIGEIKFSRDSGSATITVRKSTGDADLSGIENATKYDEEIYKNTSIRYYQKENVIYVHFVVSASKDLYTYTIALDNTVHKYALSELAKEIIDYEKK